MSPDTTAFWATPTTFVEWVKLLSLSIVILAGLSVFAVSFFTRSLNRWRTRRYRNSLEKGLSADLYSPEIIELALRYYVPPNCQNIEPAGGEEPERVNEVEQPLFEAIDDALNKTDGSRYISLLADSGMGKSAFIINYYARNISRRWRRRKFDIALLPLGIPDVDKRIGNIPEQSNTVLLLDAFDEDPLAIADRGERLKDLLELTRNFKKVLITCSTRFFPKNEESSIGTGMMMIGTPQHRESGAHDLHKLYLSPFSDAQAAEYIKKRYPFWRWQRRRQAKQMVAKIPDSAIRPLLLTHIDDLIKHKVTARNAYELYDKMVEAWLLREEGILNVDKETLRQFSGQLAINLWCNRQRRKAEFISGEELGELTKTREIPLNDWQFTGRSLLNRDAAGNYKFAHRSIMEFLFLKRFLSGDKQTRNISWSDRMQAFLWKLIQLRREQGELLPSGLEEADLSLYPIQLPLTLRYEPKRLEESDIQTMLNEFDFFESRMRKEGKGLAHDYHAYSKGGENVVIDYTTNLMWQQSGSLKGMRYAEANKYIEQLNQNRFAGYNNWRLPTLEEGMSLMESKEENNYLYIGPSKDLYLALIFDRTQRWIWTADHYWVTNAWSLFFYSGVYYSVDLNDNRYVRAVRSPGEQGPPAQAGQAGK